MANEYNKLNKLIECKKILYIPIYSCFNYDTGKLNFKADGNINRFLSTFSHCNNFKYLNILYPPEGNNINWFEESCKMISNKINLLPCEHIVKSAKVERSLEFADKVYNELKCLYEYDYIIVESQHLFLKFYNHGHKNLIYWCPVCATNDKTRDFLEPFKELDRYIFSIAENIIVASNDQIEYVKSIPEERGIHRTLIQIDQLIDRTLPCFKYTKQTSIKELLNKYDNQYKIFLPFRLTDRGYKMQEIFDYLYEYKDHLFTVFYTNPNNCDIYQFAKGDSYFKKLFIDEHFIKVDKDRDTYYTIIDDCKVIIPYFEDTEFICHAAVDEFKFGNCVICKNLEEFMTILN